MYIVCLQEQQSSVPPGRQKRVLNGYLIILKVPSIQYTTLRLCSIGESSDHWQTVDGTLGQPGQIHGKILRYEILIYLKLRWFRRA